MLNFRKTRQISQLYQSEYRVRRSHFLNCFDLFLRVWLEFLREIDPHSERIHLHGKATGKIRVFLEKMLRRFDCVQAHRSLDYR